MRAMYLPDHLLHWQDTKCNAKRQNKKTKHNKWHKRRAVHLPDHLGNLGFLHNFSIDSTFHDTALAHMTFETVSLMFATFLSNNSWKTALVYMTNETIWLIFSCSWQSMVNLFPQLAQEVHMVLRGQNLYSCPRVVALIWPRKEYFLYVESKLSREMSSCYIY